jgi:hypothetical protein
MLSKRKFLILAAILVAPTARGATPRTYVQIIVKACPAIEQTGQDHKPDAVLGYYADPINQGLIYDNQHSPTKGEREAYLRRNTALMFRYPERSRPAAKCQLI